LQRSKVKANPKVLRYYQDLVNKAAEEEAQHQHSLAAGGSKRKRDDGDTLGSHNKSPAKRERGGARPAVKEMEVCGDDSQRDIWLAETQDEDTEEEEDESVVEDMGVDREAEAAMNRTQKDIEDFWVYASR